MSLTRLAAIVRRSWPIVLLASIVGASGAYLVADRQTPVYQAQASVYFSLQQGSSGSDLNQGSAYTQAQMLSFATLATSSITLDLVISDLNLATDSRDLARSIDVAIPQNTVILDIAVSSPDPERASEIANSVASNLSTVVVELAPAAENESSAVSARVIEPAVVPTEQSSPNTLRDTALGAILGLLLGAVGAVLFALIDTRVRSSETVLEQTSLPLLGEIGRFARSPDSRPVMVRDPGGINAESFRHLRAAMAFMSVDQEVRAILITSGSPGEGKSTLSVNLALAMAESEKRVLLIDADLRRPQIAAELGLDGSIGLTTALVGALPPEEAVSRYGSTNLDLLLSGELPPNPAELLSSMAMAQLIADFGASYDLVIIDTAPVLSVADASLLSSRVDFTVLVVDASKTSRSRLTRTIRSLEITGALISGVVLNKVKLPTTRDVYHYAPRDQRRRIGFPFLSRG